MSQQEQTSEAIACLRRCVDDLATQLILGGSGGDDLPGLATTLAQISRQARDAGCAESARIAEDLALSLQRVPNGQSAAMELQKGLAELQRALENDGSDPAPERPATERPQTINALAQDPELVADFILESREHLAFIEQRILTLERAPADADALNSVFRGFHTIKGLAGFLEFSAIQQVAHEVEAALNLAREGKLAVTAAVIDVILESVDYVRRAIGRIESGATCEFMPGEDGLLGKVQALMTCEPDAPAPDPAEHRGAAEEDAAACESDTKRPGAESLTVRVDTAKLDYLVDMVGEMVIAQSLVCQNQALAAARDPRLHHDLAQLARITGEVQRTAMAMRMVPIGQLFKRAARQVRDLSRKVGKQVELVARGEDTELDKTIAEELTDPLMHMVRNAIDHGIEPVATREAAGKAPQARISLAAYHQGGQIAIEVADDGRGLDAGKILAKARQQGLVQEGAHPPEKEIFRLILEPGFSTADQVTNISGRGVGMDIVRKQVEKLRGQIEIRSRAGLGTTFLLKLPLTLAIIEGLVVSVGTHRYIVPLFSVKEMFRPTAESISTVQNRHEMALVRGRLLPMLRLHRRFGLVPRTEDPSQALLIVAESEGHLFCLMVDDLIGKQEVVIKSLGASLGNVAGVAGGAILGDGCVGLILDVGGLWGTHADH